MVEGHGQEANTSMRQREVHNIGYGGGRAYVVSGHVFILAYTRSLEKLSVWMSHVIVHGLSIL